MMLLATALACFVAVLETLVPHDLPNSKAAIPASEWQGKLGVERFACIDVLSRPSLSCAIVHLEKDTSLGPITGLADEVYFVSAGRGKLWIDDEPSNAHQGDLLYVPAGATHRFSEIEEDLTLVRMSSAATPVSGGMVAGPVPTEQTPYPETSPRGSTRIFYWYGPNSAGQVEIDYGLPEWRAEYEAVLSARRPQRWRFGQNFWTRLDSNIDLTIGGVALPAGYWYLVLETSKDGVKLIALDPSDVRKQRLDAYQAPQTRGGIVIPLTSRTSPQHANRLSLALSVDRSRKDRGMLEIAFGPHRYTADVELSPVE